LCLLLYYQIVVLLHTIVDTKEIQLYEQWKEQLEQMFSVYFEQWLLNIVLTNVASVEIL